MLPLLLPLLLCFIILIVYNFTRDYDSPLGLLLLILTILAVLSRTHLTYLIPSRLYLPWTLPSSLLWTTLVTFVSLWLISIQKKESIHIRISLLFALYLVFGLIQQLLYQYVFLDILNLISPSRLLAVTIASLYFSLFHIKNGVRYSLQAFILYLSWACIYLQFGNLLPLVVSHALLGAAYYPQEAIGNHSQIYRKLAFLFQQKS